MPLTVAIPTCNGARHLAETLRSILGQECQPFELLVVDDRSDDETVSLVGALAGERARLVVNERRLGLAGNWNRCMAMSETPWVSIFHQDDVMLPGHLESVMRGLALTRRDGIDFGLLAGPVRIVDEDSRPVPPSVIDPGGHLICEPHPPALEYVAFGPGDFAESLISENPLRCSAVVTNRAAHASVGGFDPSYRYVVDWDFWYRVACRHAVSWKLREPTVLVRWHAASETHRFKTGTDDLEEAARLLDFIRRPQNHGSPAFARQHRLARRRLSRAFLNRSLDALHNNHVELARNCLARAGSLSSLALFRSLGSDPRLFGQMAVLACLPRLASRWFSRNH